VRIVDGRQGVRSLLARAGRWRVNPVWYTTALLLVPAVSGVGTLIRGLLGADLAELDLLGDLLFAVPVSLLAAVMEEFGWRGFLLPGKTPIAGGAWALWAYRSTVRKRCRFSSCCWSCQSLKR
jgi:membrane protease YdiL (CAAX protease family)